jgi:hypothetical protein
MCSAGKKLREDNAVVRWIGDFCKSENKGQKSPV